MSGHFSYGIRANVTGTPKNQNYKTAKRNSVYAVKRSDFSDSTNLKIMWTSDQHHTNANMKIIFV